MPARAKSLLQSIITPRLRARVTFVPCNFVALVYEHVEKCTRKPGNNSIQILGEKTSGRQKLPAP